MRQKFVISRDGAKNKLKITEYAIIEANLRKAVSSVVQKQHYSLLCEETYEGDLVVDSIAKGTKSLVSMLRTRNIFPIEPHALKIAESVMALYSISGDEPVELFFDDVELVSV